MISSEKASMLPLVMALAVLKGMSEVTKASFQIKWPNDVLLNKKKICGILTEMSAEPDMVHYVVVGVGINVNMESIPKEQAPFASSLKTELGEEFNRADIIAKISLWFENYYKVFLETEDLSKINEEYSRYLINKDENVCVMEKDKKVVGIARGITDAGKLIVEQEEGNLLEVYAGEVSVRGIYGYV
jgi:BirA family biotin operon repressor/biotin-[acetyl-CoA-carboxylase] ligase